MNVAKHWHVAGRGICHLWLPCFYCFMRKNIYNFIQRLNNIDNEIVKSVRNCSMYIREGMWSKWTNLLYTHSWCQSLLYFTRSIWALAWNKQVLVLVLFLKITTLVYYRKSYLVIIIPNSCEKLTKNNFRHMLFGVGSNIAKISTIKPIGSQIWSLFAPIYMTRGLFICGHYLCHFTWNSP